ncbi:MAG: hypothetical protein HKO62_00130 [Gammaproteobacteria bacterium]|nr:hypothetical protein [Gammaproteobacteria bacterium]
MTTTLNQYLNAAVTIIVLTTLLISGPVASAQTADPVASVEVGRDADTLRDTLRPRPDRDIVDTALVFTNVRGRNTIMNCTAFGPQGGTVGRFRVRVPGNGLRFVLASDISNGGDFVGSARCLSIGDVAGSAFLLGPQLTDMRVRQQRAPQGTWITFPVVATY